MPEHVKITSKRKSYTVVRDAAGVIRVMHTSAVHGEKPIDLTGKLAARLRREHPAAFEPKS